MKNEKYKLTEEKVFFNGVVLIQIDAEPTLLAQFPSPHRDGGMILRRKTTVDWSLSAKDPRYPYRDGIILYRIEAIADFGDVKKGDKGGFIQSEDNLSGLGECWVYNDASVSDNAWVSGDAKVLNYARVSRAARVYGSAEVSGDSVITDNAVVSGDAKVGSQVQVRGDAKIYGKSSVRGTTGLDGFDRVWDALI